MMNFSEEWDRRYGEHAHLSVWPWSDLVSLVRRHCTHLDGCRVLEMGCGAGANIPFFLSLGVQYFAMEGSPVAVQRLHERFADLADRIVVGDFTVNQPFGRGFDLVVDRASLTHNSSAAIESGLEIAWQALNPGAHFIGVDWFSVRHSEYRRGEPDADEYTRTGYRNGQFSGIGRVHFSDAAHLRMLFSRFELLFLEEKLLHQVVPEKDYRFAAWNLVARKPNG